MRTVPAFLTLALFVSACGQQPAGSPVDTAMEERAIRTLSADWLELTRQRDAAKIARLFADDGLLLLSGQEPLMGVATIQEFMAKDFAANPKRMIEWRTSRIEVAA